MPEKVAFATKPAIAREMIAFALDAEMPCAFVLTDALNGSDKRLRVILESREQPYVFAVRSNKRLMTTEGDFALRDAAEIAEALPSSAWHRLAAGEGAKGPRLYDWARVRLLRLQEPPWDHWVDAGGRRNTGVGGGCDGWSAAFGSGFAGKVSVAWSPGSSLA